MIVKLEELHAEMLDKLHEVKRPSVDAPTEDSCESASPDGGGCVGLEASRAFEATAASAQEADELAVSCCTGEESLPCSVRRIHDLLEHLDSASIIANRVECRCPFDPGDPDPGVEEFLHQCFLFMDPDGRALRMAKSVRCRFYHFVIL